MPLTKGYNWNHEYLMDKKERAKKTTAMDKVLPDAALELVARRFAVLAEPMRLKLLKALMSGEKNVSTLVAETGGQQANISRHLQTLALAGLVARRKEGLQVFYFVSDPSIFKLCELVCGSIGEQLRNQAQGFADAV